MCSKPGLLFRTANKQQEKKKAPYFSHFICNFLCVTRDLCNEQKITAHFNKSIELTLPDVSLSTFFFFFFELCVHLILIGSHIKKKKIRVKDSGIHSQLLRQKLGANFCSMAVECLLHSL